MKNISSRHNPLFKRVREAMRDPGGEIVLEGKKMVEDAIAAGWTPTLLVSRGAAHPDAVSLSAGLFDSLAATRSPQDLLGLFHRPTTTAAAILTGARTPVVVLDGVQDPGNVGTIIRLAAAFDCAGLLLLPGCADPWSQKTIRSTAGAVLQIPLAPATVEEVLGAGLPLYAADLQGTASDPPAGAALIAFGSEGAGLSPAIRGAATGIRIPMSTRVESLNVAASAAILLSRAYAIRSGA